MLSYKPSHLRVLIIIRTWLQDLKAWLDHPPSPVSPWLAHILPKCYIWWQIQIHTCPPTQAQIHKWNSNTHKTAFCFSNQVYRCAPFQLNHLFSCHLRWKGIRKTSVITTYKCSNIFLLNQHKNLILLIQIP